METKPVYVWEVWHDRLFRQPMVKRFKLVKMNPKGGCTVLQRGSEHVIRPMTGKRFFTDEAKLRAHLKDWTQSELQRARSRVAELTAALETDFSGVFIDEVRSEPYPPIKNLKLD